MLVLTRNRKKSTINVGDEHLLIKFVVLEVRKDGTVKIGIDAPKDIRIEREEIVGKR